MTVAALIGLGGSRAKLEAALKSLALEGFSYTVCERDSYGIAGVDFDVHLESEHGHADHHHAHEEAHGHDSRHGHAHHAHRNLADVFAVIDRGALGGRARELAKRTFTLVAEAEAEATGNRSTRCIFMKSAR